MKYLYIAFTVLFFSCAACAQETAVNPAPNTKTVDVNKDGTPDVTLTGDGKFVSKVEADTDFDGKTDITVNRQGGEFKSAKVDSDHDGKTDKEFKNEKDFLDWVNQNDPAFIEFVNQRNWEFSGVKF